MRPSTPARALASVAALSFTVAAAAKAPRSHGTPGGDAAAPSSSASASNAKEPSSAETPADAPSASPAPEPPSEATPSEPSEPAEPTPSDGSQPTDATAPPKKSPEPAAPVRPKEPARDAEGEEPVVAVTPARDTVGGHFDVGVDAAMVLPFGDVSAGVPQSRTMGPGLSLGGDVAYGISRTVMLGAYIDVGLPSARGAASNDSIATIAAGPFIRYHLVQGLPFDPWVSGGFGFRRTSVGPISLTGVDWVRFALGGDWYPASNFGVGPILELSLGTFFSQSPGDIGSKALNAQFVVGGRIVFDGPGK